MKAKDITSQPPGGPRTPISELVPLDTPLVLQIFPIYACNFRCRYCLFSIPPSQRGFISNKRVMSIDMFKKAVDECESFPNKIRVLRFVGMGEPLLHPQLPNMIHYADESNCFERIELITNASLLNTQTSDALIDAGLTHLLISVQGTSAEKYNYISNYYPLFSQFLEHIQYFYNNSRGRTHVHIKIADCALEDEEDKQLFFELFGDMCDTIGIETIGAIHEGVEFNSELEESKTNQYGADAVNMNICTQPFYTMQINPDGNVVPCYSLDYPVILGNCLSETIPEIWNGEVANRFRCKVLDGTCRVCNKCTMFKHRAYNSDDLSEVKDRLREYYS